MADHDVLIIYGSQTGQAQSIAEDLYKDGKSQDVAVKLLCMDQFKKFDLQEERMLVVICSTTGEGDPPDNASRLWRRLKKKTLASDHLQQLSYTVLGLGDTNYTNFCQMGKNFHKRLSELGASPFYDPGFADDGIGLELVVEPWKEGLWAAVKAKLGSLSSNGDAVVKAASVAKEDDGPKLPAADIDDETLQFPHDYKLTQLKLPRLHAVTLTATTIATDAVKDATAAPPVESMTPFKQAPMVGYRCLTHPDAVKRAIEVEFDLTGTGYQQYLPGDAFAIACPNRVAEVNRLLAVAGLEAVADEQLQLSGDVPPHLHPARTLREALTYCLELRSVPKKATLRVMAEYCSSAEDRATLLWLASQQGGNDYTSQLRGSYVCVADLLEKHSSCKLPLAVLLSAHQPLQPRYYSACSAPTAEGKVRFGFNMVDSVLPEDADKAWPGLCTTFLEDLAMRLTDTDDNRDKTDRLAMRASETINRWYRHPSPSLHDADTAGDQRLSTLRNAHQDQLVAPLYLRPSLGFAPPEAANVPVVMVGPGTGVAPFIGFLQQRQALLKQTPAPDTPWHLYYGCRHADKDYLFKEELAQYLSEGTLTHLGLAVSRDEGSEFKHVQDAMMAQAEAIAKILLEQQGVLYVCGNAKTLGRSFDMQLEALLIKGAGITAQEAQEHRQEWFKAKRIRKELWG
eukprot:TRINITY_DN10268_c0_g2_i3.p1 TRINITY_DN10268_c0_g2~~TRINITY_DN10268_c0_g2_i3.p1  ORF type:complete len:693 (+),score=171.43 TRINITY_DN10268_c0_g2_i3:32-2080(+)